jgi:predicted dehydrogenase
MFEDLGEKLDGIVISTPDHMHFPIAMSAVNLGINVYCEKPLTHTVDEARRLVAAAKAHNVVTQRCRWRHGVPRDGCRLL